MWVPAIIFTVVCKLRRLAHRLFRVTLLLSRVLVNKGLNVQEVRRLEVADLGCVGYHHHHHHHLHLLRRHSANVQQRRTIQHTHTHNR